ncbi:hypothetical protein [Mucilaginibacter sp.]
MSKDKGSSEKKKEKSTESKKAPSDYQSGKKSASSSDLPKKK